MGEESIQLIVSLLFFGGLGALVKDILEDGFLKMPSMKGEKLALGFIGSLIVGATVGYLVDHSYITAFFAGYTGFATLSHLVNKQIPLLDNKKINK